MKTIKQIAEEIGVSRQAVYSKIKKPPLSKALQSFVSRENNVLTVSIDGETLIKQAFLSDDCQAILSTVDTQIDNEILRLLLDTIETLKGQLRVKDKHIEELNATIKIMFGNAKHKPLKKNYTRKKLITPEPKSEAIKRLIASQK